MPSTRSGRNHTEAAQASSPSNKKRKADAASPSSQGANKRGKPAKEQKTIEETINPNGDAPEQPDNDSTESKQAEISNGRHEQSQVAEKADAQPQIDNKATNGTGLTNKDSSTSTQAGAQQTEEDVEMSNGQDADNSTSEQKTETTSQSAEQKQEQSAVKQNESKQEAQPEEQKQENSSASKDAVQTDKQREEAMPSNILEKGIIYFFTRGRVGTDEPESIQDLQRSHFVLRPIPKGGKLTDGNVQDESNSRLLAIPKKMWPKSGKDRFMTFVEKAKVNMKTLKDEFFTGSEYTTQTSGVRQTPPVALIGEGVYAITSTGGGQGTTHLAYMLTVPSEPGQVQSDVGITNKGSFVLSLKNPESSGPAYAQLPEKPDFPKEFIDEFRGRGWMPLHPKHLDYPNAQFLIIGEDFDSSNNLEPKPKDQEDSKKETPEEELKKLEEEDEHRIEALKGDDTVFTDLGISKKDYGLMTTCISPPHIKANRLQVAPQNNFLALALHLSIVSRASCEIETMRAPASTPERTLHFLEVTLATKPEEQAVQAI